MLFGTAVSPVPQRRRRADQRQAGGECDGG
jgi:hypothetical protein